MKKFFIAAILCFAFASKARAADSVWDMGYSTVSIQSIRCTTGTAVDVSAYGPLGSTSALVGFSPALYRFSNPSSVMNAYFGNATVSAVDGNVNQGEPLISTMTPRYLEYRLGYDASVNARAKIHCIGQPSAGAGGVLIYRAMFGYK